MLTPISTTEGPQGGWRFKEPANGVVITHNHYRAFMSDIFKMREANGLFTGTGWQADVLDEVCRQNPTLPCKDVDAPERVLTLDDIRRFSISVSNWIASGGKFVDYQEAERRASICLTCPRNKSVTGCWGCHGILNWLTENLGDRRTSKDADLHGCELCLCALRAKVHIPLGVLDNEGVDFPEWCWQNTKPITETTKISP